MIGFDPGIVVTDNVFAVAESQRGELLNFIEELFPRAFDKLLGDFDGVGLAVEFVFADVDLSEGPFSDELDDFVL